MHSHLRHSRRGSFSFHAILNNERKRHRGLDFTITTLSGLTTVLIMLVAYLLLWGMVYRLPRTPPVVVDLRDDKTTQPHYVAFCAALAANEHGFPGHAYAVWSDSLPIDLNTAESLGFGPLYQVDQIPSLWQHVPGAVVTQASSGNRRNLNAIIAIVDEQTFEFSRLKSRNWRSDKFKVGTNDCVAYVESIASVIGLKTPDTHYKYPQDFVEQLKSLNLGAHDPRFHQRGRLCSKPQSEYPVVFATSN